jgi:hypothetical protein
MAMTLAGAPPRGGSRGYSVVEVPSLETPFWSVEKTAAAIGISAENIRRMCRDGRITHCTKVGQQWAINPRLEWPELFGGDAR